MEGRTSGLIDLCKGNIMDTTDSSNQMATKLQRIAWLSERDEHKQFNWLMHHYNEETLKECFYELDGKKALGADGISKEQYHKNLDGNVRGLVAKMKRMAYVPGPVREVMIPKSNGKMRPLGISNIEDKIVQKMTAKILESIYEPLFCETSYGFRPGRSCHMAIKALHEHLYRNEVEMVLDVDIKNFFGTIDHNLLREMLEEKINDVRFIRYIVRMFRAGVLSEGDLKMSEEGVPQGSICSPILANIFAHYVIDMWIDNMVKPNCRGQVKMFRYADDMIICCELESDAYRVKEALGKRLERFNLALSEEKTKIVPFSKAKAERGIKQGTFDFLGFTFYLGRSRKGTVIPKVRTCGKAIRGKLKKVGEWMRRHRNRHTLPEIWQQFCVKLRGHINYYGVSFNTKHVGIFLDKAAGIVFKWINRRSQKRSMTWREFEKYIQKNPYPRATVRVKLF